MDNRIVARIGSSRFHPWFIASFLLLFILILSPVTPGQASSTIYVNSFDDNKSSNDGRCTLREAIIAANSDKRSGNRSGECIAGSGADFIVLPAGHYLLTRSDNGQEDAAATGDLDITANLTITGAGADVTVVDGNGITDRVFHTLAGQITLSGVTMQDGHVPGDGGGLYNLANLTLTNVSIMDNQASGRAGGLYNAGTLTVSNSTIANNTATSDGSGVITGSGQATLTNVTISGHSGNQLINQSSTTLTHVTIVGNVQVTAGTLSALNTLIAGSCTGTLHSLGYNLLQNATGCTISGDTTGNLIGQSPRLGLLAANGGQTLTFALLPDSPAIEAGTNNGCPATDQRGVPRPQGQTCDMGAYELEDPGQPGPTFFVSTGDDLDDGRCSFDHCSLREALNIANANSDLTLITFAIPGGNQILLTSPLPDVTQPIILDGTTQPGGTVVLSPATSSTATEGLTIRAGGSTVTGLEIIGFSGHGLVLLDNGNNHIIGNVIANNGGDGLRILDVTGNQISQNNIHDNGGLSIDLNGDGHTANDPGDSDSGANFAQNFPVLLAAVPGATDLTVTGRLNSQAANGYTLEFFASPACHLFAGGPQSYLGATTLTTDSAGNNYFNATGLAAAPAGHFVTATATDAQGNTSEMSDCIAVGPDNTAWPKAMTLTVAGDLTPTAVEQYVDAPGQSRWYRFPVAAQSQIILTLTDLPANYDLTVYKDIAAAATDLNSSTDLALLGAEFAPDAFSPDAFSPDAFSPDAFSPDAFSPDAFSPDAFSPDAFSPDAFSPDAFSPDAFSPDAFSPDAFSPDAFSPDAFSPDAFSPDAFSPDAFSPDAFSSAQMRSLLGVSAFQGTASEGIRLNSWNNTGYIYVRVRGANGAFDQQTPFHLEIAVLSEVCNVVMPITTPGTTTAAAGNYKTIILTDMARLAGSATEKAQMQTLLASFAARSEVAGVIVDVGSSARVAAANAQADAHPACPYAKNLVAGTIKEIVTAYEALNPLEYVVIVGGDGVIPFYRYPDNAMLANENNYVPPVRDSSASQASLRLGYVLGQDAYGTQIEVSFNNATVPVPHLAVGRLVEAAAEINTMLTAYLSTNGGVIVPNTPSLVTGYDFLEDAALAVQSELEAGTGLTADTLITPRELSPYDPASWSADDLRPLLFDTRHDLIFLAGHFSGNSALAADYTTRLTAAELAAATADLSNTILFSAGCHAGYNIVDADGVPLVTDQPDWAQAAAQKGITLIAGTGYQYGDTDFIEYSERLYLDFSRQLRTGTGPIAVGQALVAAKQLYLVETPQMRGIHQKALIEATLFGFPMLSINMPGSRLTPDNDTSVVSSTTPFANNPGQMLGLTYADITVTPLFNQHTVILNSVTNPNETAAAFYLSGSDGVVTNPAELVLPLERVNVGVAGTMLRGVGFRSGQYTDLMGVLPLTGAATSELRGIHAAFQTDVFYPVQPWRTNYYGVLADPTNGATQLALTPAQFMADGIGTGTLRRHDQMGLRLYYSNNLTTYANGSVPALAAPPTIATVASTIQGNWLQFQVNVLGNPSAGVQEAWVTYTATDGPFAGQWQSLDLSQGGDDSTQWQGSLDLQGTNPDHLRFMVQAVNGVGLVGMATNLGAFYTPGQAVTIVQPTQLTLNPPVSSGVYGTTSSFSAVLTSNGNPVSGAMVTLGLGAQTRQAISNANGEVTIALSLLALPGNYTVRAGFAGAAAYAPASATASFIILKQNTSLTLDQPALGYPSDNDLLTATLTDATGRPLGQKSVVFVITGNNGSLSAVVITDFAGQAILGDLLNLPPGTYTVVAYFGGAIPLHTGEVLTLNDARYNPTTASGTLQLLDDAPVAVADAYATNEDVALVVDSVSSVLSNDLAPAGDAPTATLVTAAAHGIVTLNADGSFTYIPAPNFNGQDSFVYRADNSAGSSQATVTITVNAINDAPVAAADSYATDQNTALVAAAPGVLGNDSDVDGDTLTASLVTGPTHGILTFQANGSFTYTPVPGFTGQDNFIYQASDGALLSDPTTVTITVRLPNQAPNCAGAHANVDSLWPPDKNMYPIQIIGITDADGDPVSIVITAIRQDERVGHGSSSPDGIGIGTDTAWIRAERDGNGNGRVYHIYYTAYDGRGGSCSGVIRLPIVPHDQSGDIDAIDGGALYDSTTPG